MVVSWQRSISGQVQDCPSQQSIFMDSLLMSNSSLQPSFMTSQWDFPEGVCGSFTLAIAGSPINDRIRNQHVKLRMMYFISYRLIDADNVLNAMGQKQFDVFLLNKINFLSFLEWSI